MRLGKKKSKLLGTWSKLHSNMAKVDYYLLVQSSKIHRNSFDTLQSPERLQYNILK